MPYGRPANVRSHRRGSRKRRRFVAPWIIVATVTVMVLAGMTTGYAYLIRQSCSGEVKATVVASPSLAKILEGLDREFAGSEPSVNGKCVAIEIAQKDSASMAVALGSPWDTKLNGPAPDVWIPESSVWARSASVSSRAEQMMPDLQPSLARSPAVLAMPREMAVALGWPKPNSRSWADFVKGFKWQQHNKPWGDFKLGMADPAKSTASLLALIAMLDQNNDGEINNDERRNLLNIKSVMKQYVPDTGQLLAGVTRADGTGKEAVYQYLSAFPAIEQDVVNYNEGNPTEPLVAVYPADGSADADHPYLVLERNPWGSAERRQAAEKFRQFLRSSTGRKAFLAEGLRDPNRVGGSLMTEDNGVQKQVPTLPRAVLLPESVKTTSDTWTAVTRATNVLLVLDVSGSMDAAVPGTGKSRMALAKAAAIAAIETFGADARVGLWSFSGGLPGAKDYREVADLGRLGDELSDGGTRKESLRREIDRLRPLGNTGLFDTVVAAQKKVQQKYVAQATNMVVLITDGKNDDANGGIASIDQVKAELQKTNSSGHAVPIITIGYGEQADEAALQQIAAASGGAFLSASKPTDDITDVLFSAIFGTL